MLVNMLAPGQATKIGNRVIQRIAVVMVNEFSGRNCTVIIFPNNNSAKLPRSLTDFDKGPFVVSFGFSNHNGSNGDRIAWFIPFLEFCSRRRSKTFLSFVPGNSARLKRIFISSATRCMIVSDQVFIRRRIKSKNQFGFASPGTKSGFRSAMRWLGVSLATLFASVGYLLASAGKTAHVGAKQSRPCPGTKHLAALVAGFLDHALILGLADRQGNSGTTLRAVKNIIAVRRMQQGVLEYTE